MPEAAKDRKAEHVLEEIERKLATVDGISTADAFALGRLIQEYGAACSGQAMMNFMLPLMEKLAPKPPDTKEPWRGDSPR